MKTNPKVVFSKDLIESDFLLLDTKKNRVLKVADVLKTSIELKQLVRKLQFLQQNQIQDLFVLLQNRYQLAITAHCLGDVPLIKPLVALPGAVLDRESSLIVLDSLLSMETSGALSTFLDKKIFLISSVSLRANKNSFYRLTNIINNNKKLVFLLLIIRNIVGR